jgi:hypothetical protein
MGSPTLDDPVVQDLLQLVDRAHHVSFGTGRQCLERTRPVRAGAL